jgi:hypothetical protein
VARPSSPPGDSVRLRALEPFCLARIVALFQSTEDDTRFAQVKYFYYDDNGTFFTHKRSSAPALLTISLRLSKAHFIVWKMCHCFRCWLQRSRLPCFPALFCGFALARSQQSPSGLILCPAIRFAVYWQSLAMFFHFGVAVAEFEVEWAWCRKAGWFSFFNIAVFNLMFWRLRALARTPCLTWR